MSTKDQAPQRLGAVPTADGVHFAVWAPHAEDVRVVGTFNDWQGTDTAMHPAQDGIWELTLNSAKIGDEYRYDIYYHRKRYSRIDPYAREVTHSAGNGIIVDVNAFDWGDDSFEIDPWNKLVIYEIHVGSFGKKDDNSSTGKLNDILDRLDHLQRLGVNAIELMPLAEFAGDQSWGYNPACLFAVESSYGGSVALKQFIKEAHKRSIAVLLDVVYNHLGPDDLNLWRFDGWYENDRGGIYFYNDTRCQTPWGNTRPDYGRGPVRQFLYDNVMMWLQEYHLDGLRWDSTLYIRSVQGQDPNTDRLEDGWSLMQWINTQVAHHYPNCLMIAEDLRQEELITQPVSQGGAGFGSQWDAGFDQALRQAIVAVDDQTRCLDCVAQAVTRTYRGDAFDRVIYSESHDDVANGKARVPQEISPNDPDDWYAQKRSSLAAGVIFSSPGIPMLFQGQEFLQGLWFQDDVPLDWDQAQNFVGIVRLYRDLIQLRLNRRGISAGLSGHKTAITQVNHTDKVLVYHRWDQGGPGDDVICVANFANAPRDDYRIGLPHPGKWQLRFNSDWKGYSRDFSNYPSTSFETQPQTQDTFDHVGSLAIAPYSILIFSQDKN